jgi:hypothetical protein
MTVLNELPPFRSMPPARLHAARRQLESVARGDIRIWPWRLSRGAAVGLSIGIAVAGGTVAVAAIPSKGPVPFARNGSIDWQKVPDFVSVIIGGRTVGYVPRADVLPSPVANTSVSSLGTPIPVYNSDLTTLVGHLYSGIGFVPLGTSPSSMPCRPESIAEGPVTHSIACPSERLTLPNVIGMSTPSAAGELSGLGVVVNVVNIRSHVAAQGTVVAMTPAAGTAVSARSTVTIENSLGPNG